ncbi:MAG TPA: hypothetical protein ENI33_02505 [Thermoplasmatales archaeon]|nr:hypothetical protein [Thermoplasmatales archaeon]HEC88647.1 hypothetical protein [Thermoplasmata archaeon]
MRIVVKDAETGNRINMEVDKDNTIEEIIEEAANYWKKNPGAYVIRMGKKILQAELTVEEATLQENDVIELIPDPEGG